MLVIVLALQLAASSPPVVDDPARPSWSTSSGAVAPGAEARAAPVLPALIAGALAGVGGAAGFLVGQLIADPASPNSACVSSCGGLLIGAAIGGALGGGTAVVIDDDVSLLAIPAAAVAAPAGAVVGALGLAYLSIPIVAPLMAVGGGSIVGESPLAPLLPVIGIVTVVGIGAGITAAVVYALTSRPVGAPYVATGEASEPPPTDLASTPSSSSPSSSSPSSSSPESSSPESSTPESSAPESSPESSSPESSSPPPTVAPPADPAQDST